MSEMSEMSENMNEKEDRTYYVIIDFIHGAFAIELERTGDEPDVWKDLEAFDKRAGTNLSHMFDEDDILETVYDPRDSNHEVCHIVHDWDPYRLLSYISYQPMVSVLSESIPRTDTSGVEFDRTFRWGHILSEDVEHAGLRYHIEYLVEDDEPDHEDDDMGWYHDHAVKIEVYLAVHRV